MKAKTILVSLVLLTLTALPTLALDKAELDARIRKLMVKFDAMQAKADKRVHSENLAKAQGILLLDRTKAGFIFAFQGGSGAAMVRDPKSKAWSPVAFYKANEASLGFQVGGQQSFMVILLMSTNATRLLTEPNVSFGGEASGTAGDASGGVEGKATGTEPNMLVYDDKKGLYGGASIKGGEISPDNEANALYYGSSLTPSDILWGGKIKATQAGTELARKIADASKASAKN